MRVFVTGGSGFVGKPTVGRLIEGGHGVRCLLRSASRAGELEQLGCETIYGDVTDKASLARVRATKKAAKAAARTTG